MPNSTNSNFDEEHKKKLDESGIRQYGVYSAIVFQMLATMGIAFWGGKKLSDYWELKNNLLTVGIGLLGMILAFYNLLRQLKKVQENEK
ncbi:MAG: AtpZ/AtpI family protein [Flavobacteriaceae bacterium]|jgi:hypothetical protein|nr:AtpZ/AtpI family protein [Flavobacteriaceae bacterium]